MNPSKTMDSNNNTLNATTGVPTSNTGTTIQFLGPTPGRSKKNGNSHSCSVLSTPVKTDSPNTQVPDSIAEASTLAHRSLTNKDEEDNNDEKDSKDEEDSKDEKADKTTNTPEPAATPGRPRTSAASRLNAVPADAPSGTVTYRHRYVRFGTYVKPVPKNVPKKRRRWRIYFPFFCCSCSCFRETQVVERPAS